jgi:hypothetical protein
MNILITIGVVLFAVFLSHNKRLAGKSGKPLIGNAVKQT